GSVGCGGGGRNAESGSSVNVLGGAVAFAGSLNARDSSVVNVSRGSVAYAGALNAFDSSKINVTGGSVSDAGRVSAHGFAVITISGTHFSKPYGHLTATSGNLTGMLADGSALNVQFSTFDQGATFLN